MLFLESYEITDKILNSSLKNKSQSASAPDRKKRANIVMINTKKCFKVSAIAVTALCTLTSGSNAQQDPSYPEDFSSPMPLFETAMGDFHFEITSDSELAQRYFNQGFQLMYAFAKIDSARSFREAQKADPKCAICFWGESWAWGSYLNGAMTTSDAPRALAKLQEATERINEASQLEADMIQSLSTRYIVNFDPAKRRVQDQLYADTMAELYIKYPENLEIATLYADALFLLEERRGYRSLEDPNVIRLHGVLEDVLSKDLSHPGACHLYVHATESTPTPELAAPCAQYLGNSIPGASHINHMPSHTWNELGLWQEAIRANTLAWHSDQKAAVGEGFSIYPTHNLTMLYYAAAMGGESATSVQAAKDLAKLNNNTAMHAMSLIRFGRFDELANLSGEPNGAVNHAMYQFSQGYAALKLGNTSEASEILSDLWEATNTTTARFRFHDGKDIIGALAGILEGEISWEAGNIEGAAESFRKATEYYDALNYDEPEPLPFSPRHWLGAAYQALGAFEAAHQQYSLDLDDHPNNIWSLFGANRALKSLGANTEDSELQLKTALEASDIWLNESKL
jgi:tetratricopeptide (TPR) repeat protein